MRRIIIIGAVGALLVAILAGGAWTWLITGFERAGPLAQQTTVIIKRGAGVNAIANDLLRAGVIDDPLVFRLGIRLLAKSTPLRAGEFAFSAGTSPRAAAELLQSGKTVVRRLTIAEGLTTREIISQLNRTLGLTGAIEGVLREGSLLPETYHYAFADSRQSIVERMEAGMTRAVSGLWQDRAPNLPLKSAAEALVLASVVEKETGKSGERVRIAGVFVNRLRKGMRLQSDPTVAYGLTRGAVPLGRALTRADLKAPTEFNTYTIDGLPPSPITNPGRAAIAAVMHPLETEDLYFVADGSGGHAFAKTLAQHNQNVAKWRRIQKLKTQAQ